MPLYLQFVLVKYAEKSVRDDVVEPRQECVHLCIDPGGEAMLCQAVEVVQYAAVAHLTAAATSLKVNSLQTNRTWENSHDINVRILISHCFSKPLVKAQSEVTHV